MLEMKEEEELILQAEYTQDLAAEYQEEEIDLSIFDGIDDENGGEVE